MGHRAGRNFNIGIKVLKLADPSHRADHLTKRTIGGLVDAVDLRASVVAGDTHSLLHRPVVIEQVIAALEKYDGVVVIAVHAEETPFVREQFAHILIGTERIVRHHILDRTAGELERVALGLPVRAVGIDVFPADFVDSGILEQVGNVQPYGIAVQ